MKPGKILEKRVRSVNGNLGVRVNVIDTFQEMTIEVVETIKVQTKILV